MGILVVNLCMLVSCRMLFRETYNDLVLLQVGDFIMSGPELQLGFVLKVEDLIFLPGFVRQPKLLLIAICSPLLQRPLALLLSF